MAMPLPIHNHRRGTGTKTLICGVCREVYRSPRFLPCHHSFCLHCLEGLARACGQRFLCPACRRVVPMPPGGVQQFPHNFYIDDEELERERNADARAMCSTHPMEELIYFCKKCDLSICSRCKNTKHEGHHGTVDLFEEAAMRKGQLTATEEMLEHSIDRLTKQSALAQDNLKASREKAVKLKEQVHAHHSAIVARATELRDKVLEDLDRLTQEVEEDLSSDVQTVQVHLDNLIQLQQQVRHALDSPNDAEVIIIEREMREGEGSVEELTKMERSFPTTTQRPGLQSDTGSLKDGDLQLFLGFPLKLPMSNVTALDLVTPFYRCGVDGSCREVHAICNTFHGLHVAFGGRKPEYNDESKVSLLPWNTKNAEHKVTSTGGRITYRRSKFFAMNVPCWLSDSELQLNAISNSSVKLKVFLDEKIAVILKESEDSQIVGHFRLHLSGIQTVCAFDANMEGELFVIVGEGEGSLDSNATDSSNKGNTDGQNSAGKRSVYLYRLHHEDPVATYIPPGKIFPTAVCYWKAKHIGCQLLLVADWLNDSVHVVSVENDQLHFVRHLAAGSGDLVRPTALDVDALGYVWIGCENGWVLKCEPCPDVQEEEEEHWDGEEEEWDGQSDSFQLLHVDNESGRTPDTMSQVSEETDD